ncbi:uncharacterized protein BX663DRAFT_515401 [Cokeromyces recurvatus]|uniref:uncharacterized protein n=1 Tax=Cokeromyces recurvatus TaxID=90255 RepID=UPI0022212943|nr:uncharacterized protein BX663DRAFT_515401 [Cokeromyces recurvatus]KAI7901253.1 hypothetical protein BX663DRAFT_515401 [Cokeromyces recurvatus]
MLHLLGVNLPDRKLVSTALQYFYGIGEPTAYKICQNLSIPTTLKVAELSEIQINEITTTLSNMTIETDLKREVRDHIMHHRNINNYIGRRHAMSLPVRGQRTRNNAKTAKKLNGRWVQRRGISMWTQLQQGPLNKFLERYNSM